MELTNGTDTFDFFPGDTIITHNGDKYLVVSAKGFNLFDDKDEAKYILVDVKYGSMEGYLCDLDELWQFMDIDKVIPNELSYCRRSKIDF